MTQGEPEHDFSPEEIARGRALRRAQWPPVLAGRAVSLALLLALGLTPVGAWLVAAVAVRIPTLRPLPVLRRVR